MKGDFSKNTFNAGKHYKDVNMQQGRVLLDTDWNEQNDITDHRIETETIDTIGDAGAPMHAAGFEIIPVDNAGNPVANFINGVNIKISQGRFYADGILCENDTAVLFSAQPDFNATPLPAQPADAGAYLFFLDVWQRHITALEDTSIREVALSGADTTTRTKTVWQVRCKKINPPLTCLTNFPADVLNISTGTINARTELASASKDPCGLVTSGGYRGLANQLYRVEIHRSGDRNTATFKWSRDNGSVLAKWESQDNANPNKLIVKNPGRDDLIGFKSGDWIELIDDTTDLLNMPGVLVKLASVDSTVLTIDPATIKDPNNAAATKVTRSTDDKNPRIRRWDMQKDVTQVKDDGEIKLNKGTWIKLEDGIEVEFKTGNYKTGDYWLIPARTAEADIEWPFTTPQPPLGITHHFAKLAICTLSFSGNTPQWTRNSDCRPIFPPITELTSLYYVGGDGQEAMPGNKLPNSLKVGVANGHWPVAGAKIKFEIIAPGTGALNPINPVNGFATTNNNGIAECELTLGTMPPNVNFSLQVKASLLDPAENVSANHLPVIFNASFSDASNVSYTGGDCNNWGNAKPATVADALTMLCKRESGDGCEVTVGHAGKYKTLEEAFKALEKERDICLCLLPPEKDEHIVKDLSVSGKKSIKISGCGAIIFMKGERIELQAQKITLHDLVIQAEDNPSALIILSGTEVNVDQCSFIRATENAKSPFIIIDSAKKITTLSWTANLVSSPFALALTTGVQGWIKDNTIQGDIVLQFDEEFAFNWKLITVDQRKMMEPRLSSVLSIIHNSTTLHISGNKLNAVITRVPVQNILSALFQAPNQIKLPGYQNVIVSENIFNDRVSSFFSELITFTNNHFLNTKSNTIVAVALGQRGAIIGNLDPSFDNDSGAIIDTLFNLKIKSPNLIQVN